ncbi:MAG: histidinol dehydrogenase [Pirellulaceae bacterium]
MPSVPGEFRVDRFEIENGKTLDNFNWGGEVPQSARWQIGSSTLNKGLKMLIKIYEQFVVDTDKRSVDQCRETERIVRDILDDVQARKTHAVLEYAKRFGDWTEGEQWMFERSDLQKAIQRITPACCELLERVAGRIELFARKQLESMTSLRCEIEAGEAGHDILPIDRVGCYVPGGRYPLPSTALMTIVPAKVAGVSEVVVASPRPNDLILAAAGIAGADRLIGFGGAHAVGSLAFGLPELTAVDLIVGPGNRFVSEAKRQVFGIVGIDMLAGPSEVLIVADDSANPEWIAADLLAQAEHDTDARAFLTTTSKSLAEKVQDELERQLSIPGLSVETCRAALANGAIITCTDEQQLVDVCNRIAPEHLELHVEAAEEFASQVKHAGCVFLGEHSAEVFGDYGAGPNHTLPTAGTARFSAGLNAFTFLRARTWLKNQRPVTNGLVADAAALAELEGLNAHRRAILLRGDV